jgi:hypothetical protein
LATALAESETLALANLKKKEIAQLKDQIETLEAFQEAQHQHESNLTDSLIATISKKYAHGATDTEESRAAAHVDYNRINEELDVTRSQNQLIRKEISDLRRKLNDLKYGSFLIPVASSEHLPSGIGGPGGLVPTGLHPIPSSALALPVSSAVPTDTGVDKL